MKRISGFTAILAVMVFVTLAWAALPQTINYQGYLRNTGGTPVSVAIDVTFAVYTSASGGSALWTESRSVTPANGVYSVQLGSVNPIPANIFSNDTLWLGIKVGSDAEMTPRQQLTTVPFALRAAVSDSVAAGGVGTTAIADNSVTTLQIADGAVTAVKFSGVLPVVSGGTGSSTQNFVDLLSAQTIAGSKTFTGNLSLPSLTMTGNLTLPAATTTAGIIKSGANSLIHSFGSGNFFAGINAGNFTMTGVNNTASGLYGLNHNTAGFENTASGAYALLSNTTGNSNTAIGSYALNSNSTGHNNTALGYFSGGSRNGSSNTFVGSHADATVDGLQNATAIGYNAQVSQSNSLVLGGAGANAVNVGIGTSTPGERLEVSGTVKATSFSGSGIALTNLNAGSVTGTLAITQGGTGAINAAAALVNLGAAPVAHNHDTSYQKMYGNVAVVATSGGDYRNPLDAMGRLSEWCMEPHASNPCLLKIMPGIYDLGMDSLVMQPYVDIEGSGEETTKISGAIDSDVAGVVAGASHAELRFLTVENSGAANYSSVAIYNGSSSPKIIHVAATATTLTGNSAAVQNVTSSPTLEDVSLYSSSPNNCYGVNNYDSSPIITNVRVATGSTCNGYGIYNRSSSGTHPLQITNLNAVISGNQNSYGIYNDGSYSVNLRDSVIAAIDNPYENVCALYNNGASTINAANTKLEGWVDDHIGTHDGISRLGVTYEGVRDYRGKYRISGSPITGAGSPSEKGLVVQGVMGQTANLQEWWDMEGGIVLASMSPSGNIRLNDKDIFFRPGTDIAHGLGFYGGAKTFAGDDVNGPVLYGYGGGALGTINGGTPRIALSWNVANNVSVEGDLSAQGDLTVNSIPTGSTSYVLCSSSANRGVIQRCSASSRKLKENIAGLSLGLDTVNKLRPVSFTWKENGNEDIGFVAEEVATLQPVLAIYNERGEPDGVKYANMSAVLVKAIQEQQEMIDKLKAEVGVIDQLKAEVAELKRLMGK
jgi:hypothetical protein